MLTQLSSINFESNKLMGTIPSEFDKLTELKYFSIGGNFLTGTLSEQIESLDLISRFDQQFCQVCSEGLIPESTTTNFTLEGKKGNISCTDMFNTHNNNRLLPKKNIYGVDSTKNNEFLTSDQCVNFTKECVNCV